MQLRKFKKTAAICLTFLMLAAAVTGCSTPNPSAGPASTPGTLSVATPDPASANDANKTDSNSLVFDLPGEPTNFDKELTYVISFSPPPTLNGNIFASGGVGGAVMPLLFDRLVHWTALPERSFEPFLLEELTRDGNVYTLKIRDDVLWSDGTQVTAADLMTTMYCYVGRSTFWTYCEKIEQLDEMTVQVTFIGESVLYDNMIASFYINCPEVVYGDWALQYKEVAETMREINPATGAYRYTTEGTETLSKINENLFTFLPDITQILTNGPYVVEAATTAEMLFTKNENYRIEIYINKIKGLRVASAEAFAVDILENKFSFENAGVTPLVAQQIDEKFAGVLRKVYTPEFSQMGFTFNQNVYPLNILEVRKAISYAIDRAMLITISEPGSFLSDSKNTGLVPSLIEQYADMDLYAQLEDYAYNPEKAEELLKSIGWKRNAQGKWLDDKGELVSIQVATHSGYPSLMMPGEAIATTLEEFGFTIEFQPMENAIFWDYANGEVKQIAGNNIGGAAAYAFPWEAYNAMLNTSFLRLSLPVLEAGQDRIITDSKGVEHNITQMLSQLFFATERAEITRLTMEFMTLMNDLCLYMPTIEKTAPLRVYDPDLHLPHAENGEIAKSWYYYGNGNLSDMVKKWLVGGEIYWVK